MLHPLLLLAAAVVCAGVNLNGNRLYAWGGNLYGQLGLDDTTDRNTPTAVPLFVAGGPTIIDVAAGRQHTVCATSNGVYAWGNNQHGQLGLGDPTPPQWHPRLLSFFGSAMKVTAVDGGDFHSLVVADGKLYVFGFGFYGALGLGNSNNALAPQENTFFSNKTINAFAAAALSSFVVADNQVYVFGANYGGALGTGNGTSIFQRSPFKLEFFANMKVTALSPGIDSHTLVIADGKLYGWGQNSEGELGLGDTVARYTPVLLSGIDNGGEADFFRVGGLRSALLVGGELLSMGFNTDGEQGQGSSTQNGLSTPTPIKFFDGKTVTDVRLGLYHDLVMTDKGVFAFGNNTNGELGNGGNAPSLTPVSIETLAIAGDFLAIRAGGHASFLVTKA